MIKYAFLIEVIIFSIIAFLFGTFIKSYTKNIIYVILNYLVCASIIVSSLLLNLDNYLYSLSFTIVSFLIIVAFIKKFINVDEKYNLVFWLYIIITTISIIGFILTKKFIYNSINSEPPQGDRGIDGYGGEQGTGYFMETYSERCYYDLNNSIEKHIRTIKTLNNNDFDKNKTYFNNHFLKEKIKNICKSNHFIRLLDNNNTYFDSKNNFCKYNESSKNRSCSNNGESCDNDTDGKCLENINNEDKYKTILNNLKKIIIHNEFDSKKNKAWLQHILENSCNEDSQLKYKLQIPAYKKLYGENGQINIYDKIRFNNKEGMKFLFIDFETDYYFDDLIIKPKGREENPFIMINNNPLMDIGNMSFDIINNLLTK